MDFGSRLAATVTSPTIAVTAGTFIFDGSPHAASATATGIGGVPVAGSFSFTYNGLPAVPTAVGVYAVVASFTSSDPNYSNATGNATLTINAAPAPPTVASIIFGDGTNERSQVKQIVVTFSEPVNFMGAVESAFTVHRSGTAGTIGNVTLSANPTSGPTNSVTLTFSGTLTEFGSLVDGLYDFMIDAAQVSAAGGALDGNSDGIPGGSYSIVGTTANRYFRLFGDVDGDGTIIQNVDFVAFRNAFGTPDSIFDFDNNGTVSQDDFIQFRNRFGLAP